MGSINERARAWHLDIDQYLNRVIPASPLYRLPPALSRFLGYRKEQKEDVGNVLAAWWSFLGAFCGLAVIYAVFEHTPAIQAHHPPLFIASFGASAILEYNAIRSPLSQPRNTILGHAFSALIGVAITKLFLLHPDFESVRWIAAALSCGVSSAVMLLTGTVHPPGGASAVLAAADPAITAMGWYFVGLVLFGTSIMVLVGLVINNIQRQFPVYWWTPVDVGKLRAGRRKGDPEAVPAAQPELEKRLTREGEEMGEQEVQVHITACGVSLPEDLLLSAGEVAMLERLRERLGQMHSSTDTTTMSTDTTTPSMSTGT